MRFVYTRLFIVAAAVAFVGLPAGSFAGPPVPQGGQVTSSADVQLTVLPICKSVSFSNDQIRFSAVPSTQPVTTSFNISYDCAANAFPTIAFLSQNGCNLMPQDKTNPNLVPYQILGAWGNQLACTPADLKNHFQPITSSPTSFTLKTGPLLQLDPHVYPAGVYSDRITATLDF